MNDHLTIKHNPSMYTETFKVGIQPNSYRTSRELIKNGHEVRLPVRRSIIQHYLTPLSGRQLKDSKLIPFSVIFVTVLNDFNCSILCGLFWIMYDICHICMKVVLEFTLWDKNFCHFSWVQKFIFKNYIKIMGKYSFTNKEIKIEDTLQCIWQLCLC